MSEVIMKKSNENRKRFMGRAILSATAVWAAIACPSARAQWVAYTFEPRVAYRSSYGMNMETPASPAAILSLGWPTNWNDASLRGVLAIYFSTNTTSGNTMAMLPPLLYTLSTNTNTLSTANYTSLPVLNFTNTNTSGSNSLNDPTSFVGRVKYGSSTVYLNAVLSSILADANTNCLTNVSVTASSLCYGYTTNHLGTNGVPLGTNYFPPVLTLRLTTLSRSANTATYTNSQQLVLNLNLNTNLTKIMNTNTNFGIKALTDPPSETNCVYTNLPKCIRSNSTYLNIP